MSEADPFAPIDPLEAAPPAERVNYATGVLLDAEDFRDEQTYHRGRLATALRHLAGFGTVAGLRVLPPEAADVELELGVAPASPSTGTDACWNCKRRNASASRAGSRPRPPPACAPRSTAHRGSPCRSPSWSTCSSR